MHSQTFESNDIHLRIHLNLHLNAWQKFRICTISTMKIGSNLESNSVTYILPMSQNRLNLSLKTGPCFGLEHNYPVRKGNVQQSFFPVCVLKIFALDDKILSIWTSVPSKNVFRTSRVNTSKNAND